MMATCTADPTDTNNANGAVPTTVTPGPVPDLAAYDMLVVGMSAKDGDAALMATLEHAARHGVTDRVYTAHADLGIMEWPGVEHRGQYFPSNRERVEQTANHFGIPADRQIYTQRTVTDAVSGMVRPQSLLEYIADRRRYPDKTRRYCTSDMKVSKIRVALTPHVRALRRQLDRPVRILNITGLRAEESRDRSKLDTYSVATANSARQIDDWLPVHTMTTQRVRELVDEGFGHHWSYDSEPGARDWAGMSRLSCSICILSNKRDLILAARRRPRLAQLYAEVEEWIGHQFRLGMPVTRIIEWAKGPGGTPPGVVLEENTPEFDALAAAVRSRLRADRTPLRGGTGFNAIPPAALTHGARCSGCEVIHLDPQRPPSHQPSGWRAA